MKSTKIKTFEDRSRHKTKSRQPRSRRAVVRYRLSRASTRPARNSTSLPVITAPRHRTRHGARRGRRCLRLGLVELQSRRSRIGCATTTLNLLVQVSIDPHPELTKMGVPTVCKFIKDDEDRKVVELVISQTMFHRSYIAPPDTPPAQLASAARGVRQDRGGPAVPGRRRQDAHRYRAAVRRQGAGGDAQALRRRRRTSSSAPARRSGRAGRLPHRNPGVAELQFGAGRHRTIGPVDQRSSISVRARASTDAASARHVTAEAVELFLRRTSRWCTLCGRDTIENRPTSTACRRARDFTTAPIFPDGACASHYRELEDDDAALLRRRDRPVGDTRRRFAVAVVGTSARINRMARAATVRLKSATDCSCS